MVLSQPYQHPSTAIASYSYTDIAEGTGIVKFYGFTSENSAAVDYHLGTNPFYAGNSPELSWGSAHNTMTLEQDLDFDLTTFNMPQTIRGTATINCCIASYASGGYNGFTYIIWRLRKYSGTTETEIASVQTPTIVGGNAVTTNEIINVQLTIPLTPFKKGDILRLTALIYNYVDAGGNGFYALGVDPQNRDGTYITPSTDDPTSTTKLELYIPFNLDL